MALKALNYQLWRSTFKGASCRCLRYTDTGCHANNTPVCAVATPHREGGPYIKHWAQVAHFADPFATMFILV
eukprot:scaffold128389_cov35-Tisochrysis_lutea.AAC.2